MPYTLKPMLEALLVAQLWPRTEEFEMSLAWCLIAMADIAIVVAAVVYTVWSQRRYRERMRYGSSHR